MAQYSNPELPDEVNNSDATPLRSFVTLAGTALLIGVVATVLLAVGSSVLAPFIPFGVEVRIVAPYARQYPPRDHVVENYLQGVADKLIRDGGMALPEGMAIRVHYVDEPVVNAFATLGGHVAVYRGLVQQVPDENVLAMVMAHEVAHVEHRHPIVSLGRGVVFGSVLSILSAGAGSRIVDSVMGQSGMLTILSFNRAQEEEADATGIAALVATYGHAGGAIETFKMLDEARDEPGRTAPPEFLSTHPVTEERMATLAAIIQRNGWSTQGIRVPIPGAVVSMMTSEAKE